MGLVGLLGVKLPALAQEGLRIEQEGKLLVPRDQVEVVWQFLQDRYLSDPDFTATASTEVFTDTYYDTPRLELLEKSNSVRHRQRENLTNPEDRKSGRELVQIKLSRVDSNALNRGEYKYEVDLENAAISELHPLLAIIKKGEAKNDFIARLRDLSIEAPRLRPIMIMTDTRNRIYLSQNSLSTLTISLDQVSVKRLWAKIEFTEIETELNEITYTQSEETKRKEMDASNQKIITAILDQFPQISVDLAPKYNKAFNLLEKRLPFFRLLIRWGLI